MPSATRLSAAIFPDTKPNDGHSIANAPAPNANDNAPPDGADGPHGAVAASAADAAARDGVAGAPRALVQAADRPRAAPRTLATAAGCPRAADHPKAADRMANPADLPAAPERREAGRPLPLTRRPESLFDYALRYSVSAEARFRLLNIGAVLAEPLTPWSPPWPVPDPFAWPIRAQRPDRAWPARW
jgi:hypothetical protein